MARRKRNLSNAKWSKGTSTPAPEAEVVDQIQRAFQRWEIFSPTPTINAKRPRTVAARYSAAGKRLEIQFRASGSDPAPVYHYDDVPPAVWQEFKRAPSAGQYINAVLNGYHYGPGGWGVLDS